MPLDVADFPALPNCGGTQWSVIDEDQLATLVGIVLIGRVRQAVTVLQGTQRHVPVQTEAALKERLRRQLQTAAGNPTYHRDCLLFEIICWIVARKTSGANDVISDPHLLSTQQGVDTLKISFDPQTRNVTFATVYEQKCTENARHQFQSDVLAAFKEWQTGTRDNQLTQLAAGLLEKFDLTDEEHDRVYDTLVQTKPLKFQASLTVTPQPYETARVVALFNGYETVTNQFERRFGNTFPLVDIRAWFDGFAARVWQRIEADHV